jgi:hypothetical protein
VVAAHRRWWYAQAFEDPPDGGRADAVTEAAQFTVDALVAPAGIVPGHLIYESGNSRVDGQVVVDGDQVTAVDLGTGGRVRWEMSSGG